MPQKKQEIKKAEPKSAAIESQKKAFIKALKSNGGNVSKALITATLTRKTAYRHFKEDQEFSDQWLEALEISNDSLFTEARRRAVEGTVKEVYQNGKVVGKVKEYSDTLLIFLLKQSEAQKKWRTRIIQTGNLALSVVQERGATIGLKQEQIEDLQLAMTEKFKGVSLV